MWPVPPDPPALLPLLTGLGDVREFRRLEEAGGGPAKLPDLKKATDIFLLLHQQLSDNIYSLQEIF